MKVFNASLTVSSGERTELSDITRLVQEAIQRCPVSAGIALVHTLRATLLGRSIAVGIRQGKLALGRFQSIVFAELDGPRKREISIQVIGE